MNKGFAVEISDKTFKAIQTAINAFKAKVHAGASLPLRGVFHLSLCWKKLNLKHKQIIIT